MYRVAVNHSLALSLLKYLDQFCTLADPKRKNAFCVAASYDRFFWSHVARIIPTTNCGRLETRKHTWNFWILRLRRQVSSIIKKWSKLLGESLSVLGARSRDISKKTAQLSTLNPDHSSARFFGPAPSEVGQTSCQRKYALSGMQANAPETRVHRANTAVFTDVFTVVNLIPLSAAQEN